MTQPQDSTEISSSQTQNGPGESNNVLLVSGDLNETLPFTELRLTDGRALRLPTSLLLSEKGTISPLVDFASPISPSVGFGDTNVTTVIPIVEERLEVTKRTVPTAAVRLQISTQEFQQALDEPLAVRTFDIERIILNQPVDIAPSIRQEGATTIYSLVEEQLTLTKQLILREEVRVTQRDTERVDTQIVTLRREHLLVEREPLL